MKCSNCTNDTGSNNILICKSCYDKDRYLKIKSGTWDYNHAVPNDLNIYQTQILIGSLLGDGSLYQYKNQINAGLAIGRAAKDLKYLEFQYSIFKDFCSSDIKYKNLFDKRTNKKYDGYVFRTQTSNIFSNFRNKWYENNLKTIPNDLRITPLICAIWFADDGSITYTGKNKTGRRIALYTDSFSEDEVYFLKSCLKEETNIKFNVTRKNSMKDLTKGFYLYINKSDDILNFVNYIKDDFPDSMNRKSERWKGLV